MRKLTCRTCGNSQLNISSILKKVPYIPRLKPVGFTERFISHPKFQMRKMRMSDDSVKA